MKKILLVLSIFLFIQPVLAETFFEPQWSEFCPSKYLNAKYRKVNFWNWLIFDTWEGLKENEYWSLRKQEFSKHINKCNTIEKTEDKGKCFSEARAIEQNKNSTYFVQKTVQLVKDKQSIESINNLNNSIQQSIQTQQVINAINQPKQIYVNGTMNHTNY